MGACGTFCNILAVVLACTIGYLCATTEDFLYRVKQSLTAVYELQRLPQERIENFLKAYEMFELQTFTGSPEHMQYVKDYYETLNHLCTIGNYEKMYLPPLVDITKDTYSNQRLYEKRMMKALQLGPGKRALDIGCGRGRVAHHVSTETGASVVGVNIDQDQLKSARDYAASQGLSDRLQFVEANYNEPLPFEDNSFDAVYYVQVIGGYGTDLKKLYAEVHRVLKPGGYAAFEDYIVLPGYDEKNALHKRYVQASKAVLGVATYLNDQEYRDALDLAGFETVYRRNGSSAEQFNLLNRDKNFFLPLTAVVTKLNELGVIPKHFAAMLQRMTEGTDDCIEAHKLHLVTGDIETLVQKKR